MTRTDAILKELHAFLNERRAEIDAVRDLRGMVLDLKFADGVLEPRCIVDTLIRERRRAARHAEAKPA